MKVGAWWEGGVEAVEGWVDGVEAGVDEWLVGVGGRVELKNEAA